ncbi:MAG: NUDIX domain-containing protein [Candidatus Micrarchaeia archaeon]|jgi:predicted NUDIX family NTP pyrophosphohydrolase
MRSAGILAYRFSGKGLEVLLVHPGGPYWAKKDLGVWSIPKGIVEDNEEEVKAAKREFKEETGFDAVGDMIDLGTIKYSSGKIVHIWAMQGDFDASKAKSNMFEMEWPKGSGKTKKFPEVDKAEWFSIKEAAKKIIKAQLPFLERLKEKLG